MKMIFAIVQNEDANILTETLMDNEFSVTKLATTGGFLKKGNTTLITGVEDDKVEKAIKIIKEICETRDEMMTTTAPPAFGDDAYTSYPVEVQVGGATIFVMDVERFEKI